ncbi:uncharacterized protein PHACADRAFT_254580 [Phanerochaete carnosa HHB-10118-sp]|uniref:MYND-type domain-containing protein n=1 Tax=Phanerochaete carnosa (strain HHB-10118-sp) TaxID=650164 RepID=K5VZP1_PHACS|nr:uncharacterized protein PHACADRAFT_254580 [Phanerochaete carnosa HHB-10118-sp]EKM57053.1 hypothetical protein PHACADRAFT_254580 [Phanerochaete carnosa HHB-10118-sp]
MPGSGKRKAKRPSRPIEVRDLSNVDIPTVIDSFVNQINDARGWSHVVALLCRMFDLPDLNSRSGLRRVHSNFEQVQRKLDAAYNKYRANEKVTGGIVGIYSKMSRDAILRNKIINAGLMPKLLPLLDNPKTRLIGLQALSNVTHHGGSGIRREIALTCTPTLLRLMEEFPDNAAYNEQIIVTLAHAISPVVNDEDSTASAKAANIRKLNVPRVLELVFSNIRKPDASQCLLSHAIEFLCSVSENCHKEIKANPSALNLLVALLRSKDLLTRVDALGALCRLVFPESEEDWRFMDPNKLMDAIERGFPPHLSDALMDYSPTECDTFLIMFTKRDYIKAMMQVAQDKDLYGLGKKLAEFVTRTEFSISDGGYQAVDERTGRVKDLDTDGLPFKMWLDALPHCAKALRTTGTPADLDAADIIECKFYIMKSRAADAVRIAQAAIERSPQVAYFYYVVGLGTDQALGLRASKKGLKAKKTTPFVRHYLLWRAVDQAGQLGLAKLQTSHHDTAGWSEGIAFFTSALEDAKRFVAETPPDSRNMRIVLNWYILLTITMRGPGLSINLRELDNALKKLEITREFGKFYSIPDSKTQLRLVRDVIVQRYEQAEREWRDLIPRLDNNPHSSEDVQKRSALNAEDNLAAWLEGLSVEEHGERHCSHPSLNASPAELWHCSHCHNPSAMLRKCSGCGKTRYCDASCQKLHWSEHKIACKQAQAQAQS